jgi:hypothetical protein
MKQFIHDMIHMTEGEKLVHYWWLWLLILIGVYGYLEFKVRK